MVALRAGVDVDADGVADAEGTVGKARVGLQDILHGGVITFGERIECVARFDHVVEVFPLHGLGTLSELKHLARLHAVFSLRILGVDHVEGDVVLLGNAVDGLALLDGVSDGFVDRVDGSFLLLDLLDHRHLSRGIIEAAPLLHFRGRVGVETHEFLEVPVIFVGDSVDGFTLLDFVVVIFLAEDLYLRKIRCSGHADKAGGHEPRDGYDS